MEDKEKFLAMIRGVSKEDLLELLQDVTRKVDELEKKIGEDAEKVEFYDAVTQSEDQIEMSAVAKILNFKDMGRNKMFEFLRGRGVLRRNNEPYQEYVDREYFKVIEQKVTLPGTNITLINRKTVVYQTGLDYIRKLLLEAGCEYNDK